MMLVYFPSGGCADDVVNNRTNISLLQSQSYISWMVQECVGLSEELFKPQLKL